MAAQPTQIPMAGWRDIAMRVWQQLSQDNLSIVAPGVAFYAFLALFPALAALISIYGLFADPLDVQNQLAELGRPLPPDVQNLLMNQIREITGSSQAALGLGLATALSLSIWSATKGIRALVTALNIVYGEREDRGFIHLAVLTFAFTVGAIISSTVAIGLIVALPALLGHLGLGQFSQTVVNLVRWPFLALVMVFGLTLLYRFAPCRTNAKRRWVSWGAVLATVLWMTGSVLFSFYVAHFGNFNKTYGSLGAVVILILWFYLSAYIVLLGAEINAEMEHQTRIDTTKEPDQPLGERGAHVADTLGKLQ